jgi:hypothetical protein
MHLGDGSIDAEELPYHVFPTGEEVTGSVAEQSALLESIETQSRQ